MTMRLFLAISIEGAMQDSLLKLQHHWRYIGVRGHFVPAENMHLTLAFIGEYGNPMSLWMPYPQYLLRPLPFSSMGQEPSMIPFGQEYPPMSPFPPVYASSEGLLPDRESPMTAKLSPYHHG